MKIKVAIAFLAVGLFTATENPDRGQERRLEQST
jgi:hypothetical protein